MAEINNGTTGHLIIPGAHDGPCGIQPGPPLTVAFRWSRRGRRPELAANAGATLNGTAYCIGSIGRSPVSDGFYVAVLDPVGLSADG